MKKLEFLKLTPKSVTISHLKAICKKEGQGLKLLMKKNSDPREHTIVSLDEETLDISECICHVDGCNTISYDHVVCRYCFNIVCDDHRYFARESIHKIHTVVCCDCKEELKEVKNEETVKHQKMANSSFKF